jgi:hypothetical protein
VITVHHLNNSRSQRILWLLEELGVPYDIKRYQRDPKTMLAPPELRRVHPLGKSPVLTDDTRTVAESGAIVEYLVDRYGRGRLAPPSGTDERLRFNYWLHYAEGSAMPPLLLKLVFKRIETTPVPFFVKPITRKIAGTSCIWITWKPSSQKARGLSATSFRLPISSSASHWRLRPIVAAWMPAGQNCRISYSASTPVRPTSARWIAAAPTS